MKLIINADDFGLSPGVNEAVIELSRLGTVTSTTVMTNMPYYEEVSLLLPNPNISIGLHFNLTQGKPVSPPEKVKSLVDKEGNFFSVITFVKRLKKNKIDINDIYNELSAQYFRLFKIIGERLSHIDSHQGVHKYKIVNNAIRSFAKHNKVHAIRNLKHYYLESKRNQLYVEKPSVFTFFKYGIKRIGVELYLEYLEKRNNSVFLQPNGTLTTREYKTIATFKALASQDMFNDQSGNTYEIICHPANSTDGLGASKLQEQRITEYRFLSSKEFVETSRYIDFESFNSLIKNP